MSEKVSTQKLMRQLLAQRRTYIGHLKRGVQQVLAHSVRELKKFVKTLPEEIRPPLSRVIKANWDVLLSPIEIWCEVSFKAPVGVVGDIRIRWSGENWRASVKEGKIAHPYAVASSDSPQSVYKRIVALARKLTRRYVVETRVVDVVGVGLNEDDASIECAIKSLDGVGRPLEVFGREGHKIYTMVETCTVKREKGRRREQSQRKK